MKSINAKQLLALVLTLCFSLSFLSCSFNGLYSEGKGELKVLCSTFVPFDVARIIGGDLVTVTLLQDSGADLHSYTPTTETLEAINGADIFIYIGGSSDALWVNDAIEASSNSDLIALDLCEHFELIHAELSNDWSDHTNEHSHEHEHDHDHSNDHGHSDGHLHNGDEHIWTSVRNVSKIAEEICEVFSASDLPNAELYRSNAAKYIDDLQKLDNDYAELLGKVTSPFVFADRFPFVYLMHDYFIPYVAAFSGCSTEVNSSFSMQIGLIETVRSSGIDFIIIIEGNDKSLAEAISAETGCDIISLNSLQSVKRSEIEGGLSYINVMEENLKILKEAIE